MSNQSRCPKCGDELDAMYFHQCQKRNDSKNIAVKVKGPTVFEAAKLHWKSFLPIWIWPTLFFYSTIVINKFLGHLSPQFIHILLLGIQITILPATMPSMKLFWSGKVNMKHSIVLGGILPFIFIELFYVVPLIIMVKIFK